jgi:Transcriptional regulators
VLVQLAVADEQRLRMSELAERLLLSRSGVTRLIDRLEANGLVARVSCESDRRGQWAQLTDVGHQRLRDASPTHLRGVEEHFLDRIPATELDRLRETLERIGP